MSWLLSKAGGDSWAASSESLALPASACWNSHWLLWRWMENSSMMQVKNISNVEERWAQSVSRGAWCCTQGEILVLHILGYVLALELSWFCLFLLCIRAGCITGLKGNKIWPALWWLCFQEAVTFLWDGLMKSMEVLTLIILRHLSFTVVNT